jgi:nucleoside-diphosphate-sugar epimerase
MKIIVTGNMGYIGPSVVRQLRLSYPEATLIGVDTGFFAHCLTNANVLPETRLNQQIFADVRDLFSEVLEGADAVVYLSAISNDIMGLINEDLTMDINCAAAEKLARQAKKAGAKSFILSSSCSVYGFAEEGAKTETSSVNPLTAYARSKVGAEQKLKALADKDFKITCFRFATACGMSERLRLDLVLNDFVAGAVVSKKISILSDGTPWRPLIHIKDMARAMDWGISRGVEQGGPFLIVNAGTDEWNYQVKDLARAVAKEIPDVEVTIDKNAAPDKRSYRVNFGLFKSLAPHHQPEVSLEEAVRELKVGFEGMRFRDPGYRDSQYMRIKTLMGLRELGLLNENLRWARGAI